MGGNQEELLEWYRFKYFVEKLVTCYVFSHFFEKNIIFF